MTYERPFVQSWGTVRAFLDLVLPRQFMPPVNQNRDDWRVQKLRDLIDSDPAKHSVESRPSL